MSVTAEKLTMPHLQEELDEDELKDQVQKKMAGPPDEDEVQDDDPRLNATYPFKLEFQDRRKKWWRGDFKNEILDIGTKQNRAVLESQLSGGQPYDAMSPDDRFRNHVIAHLTYSLQKKPRPPWAQNLRKIKNDALLYAIYEEVSAHERTFLGFGQDQEEG